MIGNVMDFFSLTSKINNHYLEPYHEKDDKSPEGFFKAGLNSVQFFCNNESLV
jgi:hypothetical protein